MVDYDFLDVNLEMLFLEMFDVLNEKLICFGDDFIEFDYDCWEGICG